MSGSKGQDATISPKDQAILKEAAQRSATWYDPKQIESWLRRESLPQSSGYEYMATFLVEHFRQAFQKGYWIGSQSDAAIRAAKVEILEDVARYCRGECVLQCDDKDRWQKGHNVAAEHIAKYCNRKANEVKS